MEISENIFKNLKKKSMEFITASVYFYFLNT